VPQSERGPHLRLRILVLGLSFRHLIFDLDGTLIDSVGDLVASANATLERLRLPPQDPHTIAGFIGEGARRLVERALRAAGASSDRATVDEALALFLEIYGAHLLDTTVAYPGIEALLERLRAADVRLSVLTNKPRGFAARILDGLGLASRFGAVLGGDSLPTRKPDPAGLRRLIDDAGVPVEETLVVGDSLVDVETARNAKVAVCAVSWGL